MYATWRRTAGYPMVLFMALTLSGSLVSAQDFPELDGRWVVTDYASGQHVGEVGFSGGGGMYAHAIFNDEFPVRVLGQSGIEYSLVVGGLLQHALLVAPGRALVWAEIGGPLSVARRVDFIPPELSGQSWRIVTEESDAPLWLEIYFDSASLDGESFTIWQGESAPEGSIELIFIGEFASFVWQLHPMADEGYLVTEPGSSEVIFLQPEAVVDTPGNTCAFAMAHLQHCILQSCIKNPVTFGDTCEFIVEAFAEEDMNSCYETDITEATEYLNMTCEELLAELMRAWNP